MSDDTLNPLRDAIMDLALKRAAERAAQRQGKVAQHVDVDTLDAARQLAEREMSAVARETGGPRGGASIMDAVKEAAAAGNERAQLILELLRHIAGTA